MHDNKRTLLIILCLLLCGCIALVIWVLGSYKRDTLEIQNLICTAKSTIYIKPKHLIMKGTLVLDLQSNRIAMHYTVQHNQQEQQLFFQDIIISPLSRTGVQNYTFAVKSVHKFDSDTTGEMFAWLRLLQPTTINELTINKIGQNTYLFSLNRQIYNFCTTGGREKL